VTYEPPPEDQGSKVRYLSAQLHRSQNAPAGATGGGWFAPARVGQENDGNDNDNNNNSNSNSNNNNNAVVWRGAASESDPGELAKVL
jgi:hypothetical protein